MFNVRLALEFRDVSGLDALDERRRLKLPDDSRLTTGGSHLGGETGYHTVGEAFARQHFGRKMTHGSVVVPWSLLTPDDVAVTDTGYLRFNPDITTARVCELYAACKGE